MSRRNRSRELRVLAGCPSGRRGLTAVTPELPEVARRERRYEPGASDGTSDGARAGARDDASAGTSDVRERAPFQPRRSGTQGSDDGLDIGLGVPEVEGGAHTTGTPRGSDASTAQFAEVLR